MLPPPLRATTLAGILALCLLPSAPAAAQTAARPPAAFRLVDQNGSTFTQADLRGKPTVLHFGFTHCPVVCPTTLYEIAERLKDLGAEADAIRFVLVTVDPDRDKPEVLKDYIANFDSRIVGLTGTEPEIRKLAAAVGATFARLPTKDGGYDMEHSIEAFLLDRNGARAGTLHVGYGADSGKIMKELRALIATPIAH